jgi:hypothetical protein
MATKDAIADLLSIMNDEAASPRDRLNSAVSASRVSPLALVGEILPPAVVYLRDVIDDPEAPTNYRREAAAALAYYQRRVKKAELLYSVADQDERRETWRRVLNACICYQCRLNGRQHKSVLLTADDTFQTPACEPEFALAALLGGSNRQHRRRAQQTKIDERIQVVTWAGSEQERRQVIAQVAAAIQPHIAKAPPL